jgi:hypothetical protein
VVTIRHLCSYRVHGMFRTHIFPLIIVVDTILSRLCQVMASKLINIPL